MATGDSDIPPIPTPTPEQSATPPVEPTPAVAPSVAPIVPTPDVPAAPIGSDAPSGDVPPPPPPAYSAPAYSTPSYATPGAYAPARPQGLSIASIICGIAGVLFSFGGFGLLPSIAAVITGHLARKRQPWARGLWLTGMITGYVGIGISIIAGIIIIVLIAVGIANSGNSSTYGYNS